MRRLASFAHGDGHVRFDSSRILLQAGMGSSGKTRPTPPKMPIDRSTSDGKVKYVYYSFSRATHKSLGLTEEKVKYKDSRASKGSNPGRSRLSRTSSGKH
ncbi:hypothetical protein Ae201684P_020395 [Aphanomyces euteiches]|nr:hypothetical protein Ae201684P_020395 [Aphanomyces euteiches]